MYLLTTFRYRRVVTAAACGARHSLFTRIPEHAKRDGDHSAAPSRRLRAGAAEDAKSLEMPEIAAETAYFLNTTIPVLALVGKGVRFPPGQWIRIASGTVVPWQAEALVQDLFPSLRARGASFHVLLTDFDVMEFEREMSSRFA
jgi:hypothetical protein